MKTRSSAEIAVDPKNLDNSYLNLSFEKSLEVEAEASGGGLTASIQKSNPLDNLDKIQKQQSISEQDHLYLMFLYLRNLQLWKFIF